MRASPLCSTHIHYAWTCDVSCLNVRVDFELFACAAYLDCAFIQHSHTHCCAGTVGFALLVLYSPNIPPSRTLIESMNLNKSKCRGGYIPFNSLHKGRTPLPSFTPPPPLPPPPTELL